MSQDVEIREFLAGAGFDTAPAQTRARALLEAAGLTRAGKQRITTGKLTAANALLGGALVRVCGNAECAELARGAGAAGREPVAVSAGACEVCGGSNNRRAAAALAHGLRAARVRRVLVVGGTPAQHAELARMLTGPGLALRCVDGARGSHSRRDAIPNLEWAELLVVWGATPLPHKVSLLYTGEAGPGLRVVKLAKRGVEALCREVLRRLG